MTKALAILRWCVPAIAINQPPRAQDSGGANVCMGQIGRAGQSQWRGAKRKFSKYWRRRICACRGEPRMRDQ